MSLDSWHELVLLAGQFDFNPRPLRPLRRSGTGWLTRVHSSSPLPNRFLSLFVSFFLSRILHNNGTIRTETLDPTAGKVSGVRCRWVWSGDGTPRDVGFLGCGRPFCGVFWTTVSFPAQLALSFDGCLLNTYPARSETDLLVTSNSTNVNGVRTYTRRNCRTS